MSVEKFMIKKSSSHYTTISTVVLQNLTNYEALGLYCYFMSLPEDWIFYKTKLIERSKIGRDKLNKLMKILKECNLIEVTKIRNITGRFSHIEVNVKDGKDFKFNELQKNNPHTDLPLTENQEPVDNHYKEYKTNKLNIKNKNNIYSSNDKKNNNRKYKLFEVFWKTYPRKVDKQEAFKIWVKNKLEDIAPTIIKNLELQLAHDHQMSGEKIYTPYPSTYLKNERWDVEIIPKKETPHELAARMNYLDPNEPFEIYESPKQLDDCIDGEFEDILSGSDLPRLENWTDEEIENGDFL